MTCFSILLADLAMCHCVKNRAIQVDGRSSCWERSASIFNDASAAGTAHPNAHDGTERAASNIKLYMGCFTDANV